MNTTEETPATNSQIRDAAQVALNMGVPLEADPRDVIALLDKVHALTTIAASAISSAENGGEAADYVAYLRTGLVEALA